MIEIEEKPRKTIYDHASKDFPNECVGFLFGKEMDNRIIMEARMVINSKEGDQRRRFEISPQTYMDAEKYAVQKGLDLLGVYHSHPLHPAVPSEHDRKQAVPFFSYVIVSVDKSKNVTEMTSWRLNDKNEFDQEKINVIKE